MSKNIINIGLPSKGRLKHDTINIFKKNKLNLFSERGERDLFGYIKKLPNVKIIYLHARECIEQLSLGNIDIGFSGYDLLKESEVNVQNKVLINKRYNFGNANLKKEKKTFKNCNKVSKFNKAIFILERCYPISIGQKFRKY